MELMTLNECLSSFYDRFGQAKEKDVKYRKALADYTGATYQSLMRWLETDKEPTAERRVRTIIFFHATGYKVAEYHAWDPVLQGAAKLLAYGLVTAEELAVAFGFTGKDPAESMYKIFAGKQNHAKRKHEALHAYVQEREFSLHEPEGAFLQMYREMILPLEIDELFEDVEAADSSREIPALVKAVPAGADLMKMTPEEVATQLALLVQMTLPYATFLNSDACTSEHRELLRTLAGRNGVFKLNNQLTSLCGERARNESKGDNQ